jgi:hypothetical protein
VEGGAGRARGVHGGFLGFLLDQDLMVPAIGAAECLLASATTQQKCSVSIPCDAETKQDFGSSNKLRTIANKQQSNLFALTSFFCIGNNAIGIGDHVTILNTPF